MKRGTPCICGHFMGSKALLSVTPRGRSRPGRTVVNSTSRERAQCRHSSGLAGVGLAGYGLSGQSPSPRPPGSLLCSAEMGEGRAGEADAVPTPTKVPLSCRSRRPGSGGGCAPVVGARVLEEVAPATVTVGLLGCVTKYHVLWLNPQGLFPTTGG